MDYQDKDYNLEDGFYLANNICDLLTDDETDAIGMQLLEQVKTDITSRQDWIERNDKWMELVTQVIQEKQYPWPNASNVKFPLISTAAVQFHARSFPALMGGNAPVKCRVIGKDKGNVKAARASRLGSYMSYQVTEAMDDWVGDMDRLLFILPIIGSLYKKTYFDETTNSIVSELIMPRDLIINYDANNVKDARKTHRLWKLPNKIKEMQNRRLWRDITYGDEKQTIEPTKVHSPPRDRALGLQNPSASDQFSLQECYETHCLLDLDDDGYQEPYVVTMRASDGKVYRIVANYGDEEVEVGPNGIVAIEPKDYYTHYFFLPDPESKTHGFGFGTMVGPINEAVNTLINILTDAGHMHSLGGGFLSRGVRLKGGAVKFRPNEWKQVNTTGDDLRKGILPLPTKEPSTVLFQLLGLMIDSGKDLSSVQDQMVGKSPGQNTPYSTTQEVIAQGMKVFNGIYKRIYRSMTAEFKKIYKLNQEFPDLEMYMNVLDTDGMDVQAATRTQLPGPDGQPQGPEIGLEGVLKFLAGDFTAGDVDVIPTAEPDMVAEMEKMMKANSLLQKMSQGIPLNVAEVTKRILEAEGHEGVDILMEVPPPQMPPDVKLEQDKFEHQKQIDGLELKLKQVKTMAEVLKLKQEAELLNTQASEAEVAGLHLQFMAEQEQIRKEYDSVTSRIEALISGKERAASKPNTGSTGSNNTGGS